MRHLSSRPARCLAALLAALVAALCWGGPAQATDVYADDEADRYVGTGGLVLPASVDVRIRTEVARCAGCQWRLSSPCLVSEAGSPFSGTPVCLSVVRGCPGMAEMLRAWFRPAEGQWREIGLVCVGVEGPVTVLDLGRRVREQLATEVPPQRPSRQPATGAVSQLPVVFDSGQSARGVNDTLVLVGRSVVLAARPAWRWEFGDGTALNTSDPGGTFPHVAVAHPYRAAGSYRVTLLTTWSATFEVDGLGPFTVPDPVTQTSAVVVPVGEGRAVLAVR